MLKSNPEIQEIDRILLQKIEDLGKYRNSQELSLP